MYILGFKHDSNALSGLTVHWVENKIFGYYKRNAFLTSCSVALFLYYGDSKIDRDFEFTVTFPVIVIHTSVTGKKKKLALSIYDLNFKALLCVVPIKMGRYVNGCT